MKHAKAEGRTDSALPGLYFYRLNQPSPVIKTHAPAMVLAVILQGKKVVTVAGTPHTYAPLQYLVLTGETDFSSEVQDASAQQPYLSMGLSLSPELVVRTLTALADAEAPSGPGSPPDPAFVARLERPLLQTLTRLLQTLDDPAETQILGPLIIEELVFRLMRTDAAQALRYGAHKSEDRLRIEAAMRFIKDNLEQRLTVQKIAQHVAMSPSHFAHRFREICTVSPMRYVKHVRLERARQSMLRLGLRASEAASDVGYASPSQFTRDFKSHFGHSPRAYVALFA